MNRLVALTTLVVSLSTTFAADTPKSFPVGGLTFQRP